MNVLVTGASGFIGRHVVARLIERGHRVIAVARNAERAQSLSWPEGVTFLACDIHDPSLDVKVFAEAEAVVHLAWPGLPHYNALYHFEDTLPADYRFLKSLVIAGHKHLLVAGTCFEYGMREGQLNETMETSPANAYALAKDTLRRFLDTLHNEHPFTLQWARLFYTFGAGQNPKSLLALLDRALEAGDEEFPMSQGEQLRDYLPVEEVAEHLVRLVEHPAHQGIFNICSGAPVSVRRLVEKSVASKGKDIRLKLGYYPYSVFEPLAFWGAADRIEALPGFDPADRHNHENN